MSRTPLRSWPEHPSAPRWEMEQISGGQDFSPARIAELIELGYQQGRTHPLEIERVASTLPDA